jgi:hypothetical protein
MGVLWKIKGQYQWLGAGVLDLNAPACQCGLRDKSDLWVDFAKNHIVVILDSEFSNAATPTVRVE